MIIGGVAVLVVLGVIGSFIDDESEPPPTTSSPPTQTAASFSHRGFANGRYLEQQDPQLPSAIRNLGWVQDGIGERESEVIQDLLYIAVTSRSVVASIVSLSWVQDGIHDVEVGAFRWLNNMGSAEVASSVVSLGWVEDGIEEIEAKAIEVISGHAPSSGVRVRHPVDVV